MTEIELLRAQVETARSKYPHIFSKSPHLRSVAAILAANDAVREIGRPLYILQIGAMDGVTFDPFYAYVRELHWNGLMVEPLPDMMERLQATYADHTGLAFETVAITEQSEIRNMYRIPVEVARRANLPLPVIGCSSFRLHELKEYREYVIEESVTCIPLSSLLNKHRPEAVDVIQIDTEGYDWKILRQFDFERYQPYIINFESVHLGEQERIGALELLDRHGYTAFRRGDFDTFAFTPELLN